jgi:Holliday junction resolvase-like predicted endonuclease
VPSSFRAGNVQLFVSNYRSFRRSPSQRLSLSRRQLEAFRSNYRTLVLQSQRDLENLLRESDRRLYPFADPLRGDLLMPLILTDAREEIYSAVLEWLIHRLPGNEVLQVFGLDDAGIDRSQPWVTDREYQIRHADQIGRLDLVLRRNEKCLVAIEVKTKPYSEEGLRKHELYCAAIRDSADMRESQKVFIAQRDEGMNLKGFRFRSWRQVCLGFRRSTRSVINAWPYAEAALFLALLGTIEQNLLGLKRNRESNAPVLVSYLREHMDGAKGDAD